MIQFVSLTGAQPEFWFKCGDWCLVHHVRGDLDDCELVCSECRVGFGASQSCLVTPDCYFLCSGSSAGIGASPSCLVPVVHLWACYAKGSTGERVFQCEFFWGKSAVWCITKHMMWCITQSMGVLAHAG